MNSIDAVPLKIAQFEPSEPQRFIQMDEDGYFKMDDLRVADAEIGLTWMKAVQYDAKSSRVWTQIEKQDVIVEAFDAPYLVLSLSENGGEWSAQMPYAHTEKFSLESLTLDEWDRFHGVTARGIPFVFSRAAQASFFNQLDEFDDDSISFGGETFQLAPWLATTTEADKTWWSNLYESGETPWDLRGAHPSLSRMLAAVKLQRARILVLGCGRGHDAAALARAGHIVTAVDYSEEAVARAKKEYEGVADLSFVQADAFNLPQKFDRSFDVVFEHTLYCAIDPDRRSDLVKSWLRVLTDDGHLLAIFFASEKRFGPPYGGSEWELRSRLGKRFRPLFWQRLRDSNARRLGTELFVYSQKLQTLR